MKKHILLLKFNIFAFIFVLTISIQCFSTEIISQINDMAVANQNNYSSNLSNTNIGRDPKESDYRTDKEIYGPQLNYSQSHNTVTYIDYGPMQDPSERATSSIIINNTNMLNNMNSSNDNLQEADKYVDKSQNNNKKLTNINAPSFVLINATTKEIYVNKNMNSKYPVSGLTNLMTAYIAKKQFDLDKMLTVNKTAITNIDKDAAIAALSVGDSISLKSAIASMFVKGCVDSANVIAENVSGNINDFVITMNNTALELGLKDTTFVDPSGISNDNVSTAFDMAIIMSKVIEDNELVDLLSLSGYELPVAKKRGSLYLYSKNTQLIESSSNHNKDINASRMGYTSNSKYCIASMSKQSTNNIITVVLKAEGTQFSDTKKSIDFAKTVLAENSNQQINN